MMAAFLIAGAETIKEHHSDGTSRRQISLQNCILRKPTPDGFMTITLSSAILAEDETAEMVTESIIKTLQEGCATLATLGASRFSGELRGETKTTAKNTKDLNGEKCRDNVSGEERMASLDVDTSNSINES